MINQFELKLPEYKPGFHLITDIIVSEIKNLPETGILHVFLKHTSAALTINENADPSVRHDLKLSLNEIAPEHQKFYTHTSEGSDDMPSHVKSSILGASLSIPITNHRLNLGIWQGIYLCEFRNYGGKRNLVITIYS